MDIFFKGAPIYDSSTSAGDPVQSGGSMRVYAIKVQYTVTVPGVNRIEEIRFFFSHTVT